MVLIMTVDEIWKQYRQECDEWEEYRLPPARVLHRDIDNSPEAFLKRKFGSNYEPNKQVITENQIWW